MFRSQKCKIVMIMMMFDDFPMVDQSLGMPQLMLYKLLISCFKRRGRASTVLETQTHMIGNSFDLQHSLSVNKKRLEIKLSICNFRVGALIFFGDQFQCVTLPGRVQMSSLKNRMPSHSGHSH